MSYISQRSKHSKNNVVHGVLVPHEMVWCYLQVLGTKYYPCHMCSTRLYMPVSTNSYVALVMNVKGKFV